MAQVNVLEKTGEIDGKPIKWTVLQITGSLDGLAHTLEIKLMKTEAILANILLKSNENLTVNQTTSSGAGVNTGKRIPVTDESALADLGF